jgi:hypothetical protein
MVMAQLSFGVVSINAPTSNLSYLLPQVIKSSAILPKLHL